MRLGSKAGPPTRHANAAIGLTEVVLLAALLVAALTVRALVIRDIPNLFGPGDPGIYFQMGRGVLHHGVPRVEFLHHFLTPRASIAHIEDYYEPAFGYLVGLGLRLGGDRPSAGACVSLVCAMMALVGLWTWTRRLGRNVALVAVSIVVFEPWSVLYGGLLMKEAAVTLVALSFLEYLRRALVATEGDRAVAVRLGLATVCAGLVQYELIPILGVAVAFVLWRHRRPAFGPYVLAAGIACAILAGVTDALIGVPISAKYAFFIGRSPGDPDPVTNPRALPAMLAALGRLVPAPYLGTTILTLWYPLLAVLAVLGARAENVTREQRTIWFAFTAALLYLHAVAGDLWARDFIPLTLVLAAPAAIALSDRGVWRGRWPIPLIVATMVFLFAAPPLTGLAIGLVAGRLPALSTLGFWPRVGLALAVAAAVFGVARQRWRNPQLRFGWLAGVLAVALGWSFWLELPWPRIYANPQFPDYEIERARRERVGHWVAATVPSAPIIAQIPAEVALYTGFPAIVMPETFRNGTFDRLATRYGARYLLVEHGRLPDSVLAGAHATLVGEREGCRLFALGPGGTPDSSRGPTR